MFAEILASLAAAKDVATIVRNQPGLDHDYIRRWLEQFDAGAGESAFTARFEAVAGKD